MKRFTWVAEQVKALGSKNFGLRELTDLGWQFGTSSLDVPDEFTGSGKSQERSWIHLTVGRELGMIVGRANYFGFARTIGCACRKLEKDWLDCRELIAWEQLLS